MNELTKRYASLFVLLSSILGFAAWSILFGQDINWDLKNYHYYNAYAVFTDRLNYDVAPAQLQTFYNPALDLLPYLLIQHFPPRVFGFIMGAWHGLNLWLVFLIGREIFVRVNFPRPAEWASICALVAVVGPVTVSEVGTTLHDLTASVFILGAIYLYLKAWPNFNVDSPDVSKRRLVGAGFLLGLGSGLKLTMAIYAFGMVAAILVVQLGLLRRYSGLIPLGVATLLGFLIAAGPWMWVLWEQFGNPVFPLYNLIFQSPYAPHENLFDARFLPKSIGDALRFPANFNLAVHAGSELPFQDIRIAILYIGSFVGSAFFLADLVVAHRSGSAIADCRKDDWSLLWLLVFVWVSYLIWLKLFAIYRYLICIELLVPLILLALVGNKKNVMSLRALLVTILLFIVFMVRAPDWGRLPWANSFFGVSVPNIQLSEQSVVLISSKNPLAYVIPKFPVFVRFVRVEGNFPRYDQSTALTDRIKSIISESAQDLHLMTYKSEINKGVIVVNQYIKNGVVEIKFCEPIKSRLDSSIVLCRLSISKE